MKKILFVLMALCLVSSLAFAADDAVKAADATKPVDVTQVSTTTVTTVAAPIEAIVLKGDIIDNMCAGANKDTLAEFVKTHTKDCALKCATSGYSIFADNKLSKFDNESNAKVEEFLKKADSKLQVSVTAKQVGDELNIVSIENQQ